MTTELPPQILITASGVCPLVLVPKESNTFQYAAFVYIDDTRHIPSLKINGAEVGAWLTGKITLTVHRNDQQNNSIRKGERFDKIIDLEPLFSSPIQKDFSALTAQFEIDDGEIFSYKLLERHVNFLQEQNGKKEIIRADQEIATEIGVLIELNPGGYATLHFEDHNIDIILKDARFHIELDNSCNEASSRCPGEGDQNDFLLNYKILRIGQQKPISIQPTGYSPPPPPGGVITLGTAPRICGSLALMIDSSKKPDPDIHYIKSLQSILDDSQT